MGGASSFYAMLAICGFLSATWAASKISKLVGISSIVLEIATGVVLGPRVAGLISSEYAVCEHQRHAQCSPPTDLYIRLAEGDSIGQLLDTVAKKDYCDFSLYSPGGLGSGPDGGAGGGHHHGSGDHSVGTTATTTATVWPSTSTETTSTTAPARTTAWDMAPTMIPGTTTTPSITTSTVEDVSDNETSDGLDGETNSTENWTNFIDNLFVETTRSSGAVDDGRLLSGGGGAIYASYEECLEKKCEAKVSHECGLTPDVFTLIGHAGVALMIFESGMHFDFEKAKVVGAPACAVAVLGTVLPLIAGSLLVMAFGKPFYPHGISAGTALAPTSVGIALRLLGEAGVLQEAFGQAIITAAFVDDILSLILFNVLFSLGGEFDAVQTVVKPLVGIVFMGIATALAVKFWPTFLSALMATAPERREAGKVRLTRDELLFMVQMGLLVLYALITHLLGTHLWGCFIAGMSFACFQPAHHAHHVWVKQTKRVTSWMIRIFFACTVAFSIPIGKLLSADAFLKGSILGIFACIVPKVVCAFFMGPPRFVIGWAMVGRAEFAYLIAQMAASANMLDEETFSICIWALLYATVFAPFVFRVLLNRYVRAHGLGDGTDDAHALKGVDSGEDVDGAEASDDEEKAFDYADGGQKKAQDSVHEDNRQAIDPLQDLEAIKVEGPFLEEEVSSHKLSEAPLQMREDGMAQTRQGDPEAACETAPATSSPTQPSSRNGRSRPKSGKGKRPKGSGKASFPGSTPTSSGFLCCLFFRKVIVD